MKHKRYATIVGILIALAGFVYSPSVLAQGVPVALAPVARQQFFLPTGTPNAAGCLYFFDAGTTMAAPTYTDITGTILNSNPVILDSGGSATIYLADRSYKVQMWSNGGGPILSTNCYGGTQIWMQDNVNAYQVITGAQQIIFAGLLTDPVGVAGEVYYNTVLGRLRFFNSAWDTIPTDNSIDIFTNKTIDVTANDLHCNPDTAGEYLRDDGSQLVCATIQAGDLPPITVSQVLSPYPNEAATGTTANMLAKLTGAASSTVIITTAADTKGAIGICDSSCGTTGNAQITTVGQHSCVFDGATTAGDYVGISASVNGNCTDIGSDFLANQQVLGRVLSTHVGGGTYAITLFGTEFRWPPVSGSVGTTEATWSCTPSNLEANAIQCETYFPQAHTLEAIAVYVLGSCVGAPTVAFYDETTGTPLSNLSISGIYQKNTGLSVAMTAAHDFSFRVTIAGTGCSAAGVGISTATAIYK